MSRPIPISAELALLAACDLEADDHVLEARVSAACAQVLDWQRFADLALGNQMAGLAGARLERVAPGTMPGDLAAAFRRILRQQSVIQMLQTEGSASLSRLLDGAGVRVLVVKGMALAHMLYPHDPAWRISSDIDLLVDPADLDRADAVLRGAGYQRTWPAADLPVAGRDMVLLLANVFNYQCPNSGQQIELHHRLTTNPHWLPQGFDALWASSQVVETASGPIRGLSGPLLVHYLALHALGHHGFRLKWICDIAGVLRREAADSCTGLVAATHPEISAYPARLMDGVLTAIRAQPVASRDRATVRRIMRDLEDPSDLPTGRSLAGLADELRYLWFQLRLSPGLAGKGQQFVQAMADPRDVAVLGLGRRFAAVYAVLGPLLALRRGLMRR